MPPEMADRAVEGTPHIRSVLELLGKDTPGVRVEHRAWARAAGGAGPEVPVRTGQTHLKRALEMAALESNGPPEAVCTTPVAEAEAAQQVDRAP